MKSNETEEKKMENEEIIAMKSKWERLFHRPFVVTTTTAVSIR